MKKFAIAAALLMAIGAPAYAQDKPLTVDSTVGALLDNPKTLAVLKADIPEVVANPNLQMGREMPLRGIAQFEPTLTEEKLKKIDADLAAAQAK
ncbi:MAG: hypothetical protein JWO25_3871 [Alphaproteobacteria bacterium]|nr:hypothetical protein [Alphaproteobacteria bacterium]MDB5722791.1 hypothetical protein [Alphaproteobacteria bacterium]